MIYNLKTHLKVFSHILQEWVFSVDKCNRKKYTLCWQILLWLYELRGWFTDQDYSEFLHRWHTNRMLFRLRTGRGVVWHTERFKVILNIFSNNINFTALWKMILHLHCFMQYNFSSCYKNGIALGKWDMVLYKLKQIKCISQPTHKKEIIYTEITWIIL